MSEPLDEKVIGLGLFGQVKEIPCAWAVVVNHDRDKAEKGYGIITFPEGHRCRGCGGTNIKRLPGCKVYREAENYDGGQNEQSN